MSRTVARRTVATNAPSPPHKGATQFARRVSRKVHRRSWRASKVSRAVAQRFPNSCRAVAPGAEMRPEFDQVCPMLAKCVAHAWPSLGLLRPKPGSAQRWPTLAPCDQEAAQIGPRISRLPAQLFGNGWTPFGATSELSRTIGGDFLGRVEWAAGPARERVESGSRPAAAVGEAASATAEAASAAAEASSAAVDTASATAEAPALPKLFQQLPKLLPQLRELLCCFSSCSSRSTFGANNDTLLVRDARFFEILLAATHNKQKANPQEVCGHVPQQE